MVHEGLRLNLQQTLFTLQLFSITSTKFSNFECVLQYYRLNIYCRKVINIGCVVPGNEASRVMHVSG